MAYIINLTSHSFRLENDDHAVVLTEARQKALAVNLSPEAKCLTANEIAGNILSLALGQRVDAMRDIFQEVWDAGSQTCPSLRCDFWDALPVAEVLSWTVVIPSGIPPQVIYPLCRGLIEAGMIPAFVTDESVLTRVR